MNGKIYKITNNITDESYIGQTVNSLEERFRHHKQGTRQPKYKMTKLQQAMDLYGKPAFSIELIEDGIEDIKTLSEREKYYIKLYNTQNEYNSTAGGESRIHKKSTKGSIKQINITSLSQLTAREQDLFIFIISNMNESKSNSIEIPFRAIRAKSNPRRWSDDEIKRTLANIPISFIDTFVQQEELGFEITIYDKSFLISFSCFDSIRLPINLIDFLAIKKKYSKILYLIMTTQLTRKEITYNLDEIIEIMGLPDSYKLSPKKIKSQVIDPSISEIKSLFNNLEVKVNYGYGHQVESYTFRSS